MSADPAHKLNEVLEDQEGGDNASGGRDSAASFPTSHKLSDEQKLYVCQQIAVFAKPSEVVKGLEAEFGVKIRVSSVHHYQTHPTYAPIIKQIRDNILKDVSHIPMAHKSKRLAMLQRVYDTAMQVLHTSTTKFGEKVFRSDARTAAIAVEYARREMEGDATLRLIGEDGEPAQTGVMRTPSKAKEADWEKDVADDLRDEQVA